MMYIFGSPRKEQSTSYMLANYGLSRPLAKEECLFRGDGVWRPEDLDRRWV